MNSCEMKQTNVLSKINEVVNVSTQVRNLPKYYPETQFIAINMSSLFYKIMSSITAWLHF